MTQLPSIDIMFMGELFCARLGKFPSPHSPHCNVGTGGVQSEEEDQQAEVPRAGRPGQTAVRQASLRPPQVRPAAVPLPLRVPARLPLPPRLAVQTRLALQAWFAFQAWLLLKVNCKIVPERFVLIVACVPGRGAGLGRGTPVSAPAAPAHGPGSRAGTSPRAARALSRTGTSAS